MAQLAVAGGGAAIGAVVGTFVFPGLGTATGAQIGWAIGGVAGALLFPPKGENQSGPRLGDLSVQTSGYGVPIPLVAGQAKLAGNVIWMRDIREQATTRRQGKGGGGPKVTTYSYYGSWAVGLCEWLVPQVAAGVLRIWLDNKLVFDATGESDTVAIPGLVWRFYPGDETQLPDPLIEATVGADNAPAHRGMAYIVFDDVPLDVFGNRVPNVVVELVGEITRSFPEVVATGPASPLFTSSPSSRHYNQLLASNVAVDYARGRIYEGRAAAVVSSAADELIRVYDIATMETISEHRYDQVLAPVMGGLTPTLEGAGLGQFAMGADGFLYVSGGSSNRVPLFKIDPDSMVAVDWYGASILGAGPSFGATDYLNCPTQIVSFQVLRLAATPRTFLAAIAASGGMVILDADFMEYVWGDSNSVSPPPFGGTGELVNNQTAKLVPGLQDIDGTDVWRVAWGTGPLRIDISRVKVTSGALDLTAGAAMGVTRSDFTAVDVVAELDASATGCIVTSAFWDQTDDSLVITIAGSGGALGSYGRFTTFKWTEAAGVVWTLVNHAGGGRDDARGDAGRLLSGLWGRGGNLLLQPGTGDTLVNASGATWEQTLAWLSEQEAVIGWNNVNRQIAKRYLSRVAPNALTDGVIVEALCLRAGMDVSEIDVSELTDSLRGYMLARPMSARDASTPLAARSQFDAVEEDDVLVFRKRAGAVVAAIPYEDLVREDPDASVIEEQRAQDVDLPREVTVRFADIERGWEQNAQRWSRPKSPTATMHSLASAGIDLPMPLTASEAKAIARRFCMATWRERTRLTFSLGPKWARLVPTDVITVGTRDGATIRCRILSTQLGANWITRVEAVTEDAAVYGLTATADGGSDWDEPQMPLPYSTRLVVPDLALVEDGDDMAQVGLREYAFACAYGGQRFRGVTVIERGAGEAWSQLGVVTTPVEWGGLIETPPEPATPWTWDESGSLRVRMTQGEPESATSLEVLNGANRGALVASDGTAEIVQWRTATQEADDSWTLTGLLRGRRGTEDLIASRAAGNLFLILDTTRLLYDGSTADTATPRTLKAVSLFQTEDTAPGVVKSQRGRAETPWAPCQLASSRDGSDNLTITWVRRTRIGGELLNGIGTVPLNESSEAYEVDILNGPESSILSMSAPGLNNGDPSTGIVYSSGYPYVIELAFDRPQLISTYGWDSGPGFVSKQSPSDWTFEGWDGSAWVVLDTQTGETPMSNFEVRTFSISVPGEYSKYRWHITAVSAGTFLVLGEVFLYRRTPAGPDLAAAAYAQSVVRTISVTAPTCTYSAANQTTDFGGAQAEVFARIHQMSGIVGRGVPAEFIA
jgi:hypothetical protein